jgi:hypothetical protein
MVVAVGATVLVAVALTGLSLRLLHIGGIGDLPSPSASPTATGASSSTAPSSSPPSASPTPYQLSPWHLVQLQLPGELKGYLVNGVSPNGSLILVQEPQAAQSVYLIVSPTDVRDLVAPGHTVGAPIGSGLSPDARFVLLTELGQAWLYDTGSKAYTSLPNPPGTTGGGFWVGDASHLLVLTGPKASHQFGGTTNTQLWRLDLQTLAFTKLGTRHDGLAVYPTADGGAVLLTDTSLQHDNTGSILYRVLPDGSDRVLYDLGGSQTPPAAWAVAPDGQSVAFNTAGLKVLLFDGPSRQPREVAHGIVQDFSPDSILLRIVQQDGGVQAIDRTGQIVTSLPGSASGWSNAFLGP